MDRACGALHRAGEATQALLHVHDVLTIGPGEGGHVANGFAGTVVDAETINHPGVLIMPLFVFSDSKISCAFP